MRAPFLFVAQFLKILAPAGLLRTLIYFLATFSKFGKKAFLINHAKMTKQI